MHFLTQVESHQNDNISILNVKMGYFFKKYDKIN